MKTISLHGQVARVRERDICNELFIVVNDCMQMIKSLICH